MAVVASEPGVEGKGLGELASELHGCNGSGGGGGGEGKSGNEWRGCGRRKGGGG